MIPVQLHIKESFYEDYLNLLFPNNTKNSDVKIVVKAYNDLGKFIHSQVLISDTPKQSYGTDFITIYIPLANHNKENKFIYFDEYNTEKINKAIAFYFNTDFRQFCISGAEKGIQQNIVIQSFINVLNLRYSEDLFERLKKKDYRRRKELNKYIMQGLKITQKELYVNEYQ